MKWWCNYFSHFFHNYWFISGKPSYLIVNITFWTNLLGLHDLTWSVNRRMLYLDFLLEQWSSTQCLSALSSMTFPLFDKSRICWLFPALWAKTWRVLLFFCPSWESCNRTTRLCPGLLNNSPHMEPFPQDGNWPWFMSLFWKAWKLAVTKPKEKSLFFQLFLRDLFT